MGLQAISKISAAIGAACRVDLPGGYIHFRYQTLPAASSVRVIGHWAKGTFLTASERIQQTPAGELDRSNWNKTHW
jgi:hypothetical protein